MTHQTLTEVLDDTLHGSIELQRIPGVAALVSNREGVIYEGAFGKSDIDSGASMTVDTPCYIASMVKPVLAVAAMQLVERGVLTLRSSAAELLPALANLEVLEGVDGQGRSKFRRATQAVNLHHLLTHTSGFSFGFWDATMRRYMEEQGLSSTPLNLLMHEPGERWSYGISMNWVSQLIEKVTAKPLTDVLAEQVLDPLKMQHTWSNAQRTAAEQVAKPSQRGADETLGAVPEDIRARLGFTQAAWYGSARDFMNFCQMLLGGGEFGGRRLLDPHTVDLMFKNQIGALDVTALRTVEPNYSRDVDFYPGMQQKWGYGFLINTEQTPQGRSPYSVGWTGIANTFFWIDPHKGVAGVFMAQVLPLFDEPAIQLYRDFESAVYRSL